jgi:murein hydrolase activator
MKRSSLLIFSFFLLATAFAQVPDKAKLENERKALQNELKAIQADYNKVKGQKKQTLGQLNLLQRKLQVQQQYISNINHEIRMISDDIYLSTLELNKLQRQLDTLKEQYSKSVQYAYKNKSNYDYLNFIFSANTFNDALKRISYLRAYRNYRQQQVENIHDMQKIIADRQNQLMGKKAKKSGALQNQTSQMKELEVQKKEKDVVVNSLKSREKELVKEINAKKNKDADLKRSISIIIQREIAARKKEEADEAERLRKLATANPTTSTTSPTTTTKAPVKKTSPATIPLNEKEVALSSSFASNKGKLPWPVDNGAVTIPYGPYSIPGTSLKGDNPGLTISTSVGASVKSVFDGEVIGVFNLGDGMAVTISHGKYFTTYSNLSSVSVSKGTQVRTGQVIGRAGVDDETGEGGKIDLILMIEKKETNPAPWLRR